MGEKNKLDEIAESYNPKEDFDYNLINYGYRKIRRHITGKKVLEMGCANGVMSELLLQDVDQLDIVDGSKKYIKDLSGKSEFDRVNFHHSLFEEFDPDRNYSDVIMARAMEHLENPVKVLEDVRSWLAKNGKLHVVVPNANSLHRRVGVALGILKETNDLSERDRQFGHCRVYRKNLLKKHLNQAGFEISHFDGIFLKPLSNSQLEDWDEELLDAFYEVGNDFPDLCAEIYMIANPN